MTLSRSGLEPETLRISLSATLHSVLAAPRFSTRHGHRNACVSNVLEHDFVDWLPVLLPVPDRDGVFVGVELEDDRPRTVGMWDQEGRLTAAATAICFASDGVATTAKPADEKRRWPENLASHSSAAIWRSESREPRRARRRQ